MGEVEYRAFHPRDARRMQRIVMGRTRVFGMTAVEGGNIRCYGGLFLRGGRWWGFLNVFSEEWRKPALIHRFGLDILAAARRAGITVYAMCDTDNPRAVPWLKRLGFRELADDEKDAELLEIEAIRDGRDRSWVWS